MLKFENVTKGYENKKALNGISLSFKKGKVYALVGPNGSGKSTMMKIATGLVKPSTGLCTYNDLPIGVESKAKIAYMSTEPFYYDYMRIRQVFNFHKDFYTDFNEAKFYDLLKFMELDINMKVKSLSSGMAAKLKITTTLSRDAEVIMLDEPLNGIDLIGRDQIINAVIKATNPNSTFIISSHLFDELEPIVDNVVFIKNGSVLLDGEIEQIRLEQKKSITDLYREIYGSGEGLSNEVWGGKKNA